MPHPFSNNHINNLGTLVFTLRFQEWVEAYPSNKPFVLDCLAKHADERELDEDTWTSTWRRLEDVDCGEFNIKTAPSPIGVATTIYFPNED